MKVCTGCGAYVQLLPEVAAQATRCPECGHVEPTCLIPLFILTGASGTGKTAVIPALRRLLPGWEVFETDIVWGKDWDQIRGNWLRIAHSIAQSGRPTLLCGTMLPADIDRCDHRAYFTHVHYAALHCRDDVRIARLRARPGWRGCTEEFIAGQQELADWLLRNHATVFDPPLHVIDTSAGDLNATTQAVAGWAVSAWAAHEGEHGRITNEPT